jgi:hypothetical protein
MNLIEHWPPFLPLDLVFIRNMMSRIWPAAIAWPSTGLRCRL